MPSAARYDTLLVISVPIGGVIVYRLRGLKRWSQLTDRMIKDEGEKAHRLSYQFASGHPTVYHPSCLEQRSQLLVKQCSNICQVLKV